MVNMANVEFETNKFACAAPFFMQNAAINVTITYVCVCMCRHMFECI